MQVGLWADLRHKVVVIRVEPFGHLGRCVVAFAPGDREVAGEVHGAVGCDEGAETGGNGTDRDRGIQHLVVEGEGLGNRGVGLAETERHQALARDATQLDGRCLELGGSCRASPERLDGFFELTATADPGVAQNAAGGESGARHTDSLRLDDSGEVGPAMRPTPSSTDSAARCWLKV